jgi:hypothetical protein
MIKIRILFLPNLPYDSIKSTFDKTLICGNSICNIVLSEINNIEIYFVGSVQ